MWVSGKYIVIMSVAAMLALIRGFVVAGILDVASFGLYATILATGMFLSALVSFGEIERTIKSFPRLWMVEHHRRSVIDQADKSAFVMLFRAGGLLLLLLTCGFFDAIRYFAEMGIFVVLIALNVALSSLYASAIRATTEIELLARNTLLRALIVIVFGLSGAYFFGWQGAIVGEVSATILGTLITRHSVIQKTKIFIQDKNIACESDTGSIPSDNGLWLFAAGLLASAPVYLDRAFVASVLGPAMVGTFGFLMLFVTSANTLTGIVVQKIGPQLIKMQHFGDSINTQIKFAIRWLILIWVMCVAGIALVSLSLFFEPARYFFDKFQLDFNLISAAAVMSLLQVGVVFDFILISRSQERAIFFGACLYFVIAGIAALLVFWLKLSLVNFIWLLAIAKVFHITAQAGFIGRVWYGRKRQLEN